MDGWTVELGNFVLGDVRIVLAMLVGAFALAIGFRRFFVRAPVAIGLALLAALFLGASLANAHFRANVLQPDNIAILMMLALTAFFTWVGLRQAVENDRRRAEGLPLAEEEADRAGGPLPVWPRLLYAELICALLLTSGLLIWSLLVDAPLEEPADPTRTPNPAKAPWYFLGLQELLVYFPPWIAGVVVPALIIFGLCAIPYLDRNPSGEGRYVFRERRLVVTSFLFGFLVLWVGLILIGTFLRGPNWDVFGPYEAWDPLKVPLPAPERSLGGALWGLFGAGPGSIFVRELPGLLLLILYPLAPILIAARLARKTREEMGTVRFVIGMLLLLAMLALPLKMLLYHAFDVRDLIAFPGGFRI